MTKSTSSLCGLFLLCAALYAPSALGDEAQPQKDSPPAMLSTTASTGIVSQVSPGSIAITTTRSPTPVTYAANEATAYVDEAGNPVAIESVKSGAPVTVYYSASGGKMVATKVIVKRS